jgi:hypothetical protein
MAQLGQLGQPQLFKARQDRQVPQDQLVPLQLLQDLLVQQAQLVRLVIQETLDQLETLVEHLLITHSAQTLRMQTQDKVF